VLTAAHVSATEVNNRAKLAAEVTAAGIVTDAQTKAEGVMREAAKKAELLREQVAKEAEAEIAKTAILAAEKVLRQNPA
jgi:vacuolar-type H+-ATPase subunit E/Vma4